MPSIYGFASTPLTITDIDVHDEHVRHPAVPSSRRRMTTLTGVNLHRNSATSSGGAD